MDVNTEFYSYWAVVLAAFFISVVSFRKLELPLKFISLLLGYDLLSEMTAHIAAVRFHNNMPVYHVSVPVTALFTSLYYNYSVPAFRRYHVGWLIVALLKNVHFLVSLVLLFYWSGTMSTWFVLSDLEEQYVPGVFLLIWMVNILTYSGIGAIFLMYSKRTSQ
jgi:hypothetical protein